MSEQARKAAAMSLAALLDPDTSRPTATGVAHHGQHVEGLGAPAGERPDRAGALPRLLRALVTRLAAWRERRAVIKELTSVSNHTLAERTRAGKPRPEPDPAAANSGG